MLVQKFRAPTIEEALTQVKDALGPEALVLSFRERGATLLRQAFVELTATGEAPAVQSTTNRYAALFDDLPKGRAEGAATSSPSFDAAGSGKSSEAPADATSARAEGRPMRRAWKVLDPQALATHDAWAVVGVGGAGKTSLLVKLALRLKSGGAKVRLVAGDGRKLAARAELASYARLAEVGYAADGLRASGEIQLIDTPALDFGNDGDGPAGLADGARAIVVLDATQRACDMKRVVARAARFSPVAVAFTKCDLAADFSAAAELLDATGLACLGVSIASSFRVPFRFLSPAELADLAAKDAAPFHQATDRGTPE